MPDEPAGCAMPTGTVIGDTAPKGSEACPAGWEPGQPTLKPGPDLVGNV